MSDTTRYPVPGSCQCGQVRYRLLGAPKIIVACHCRDCQKLSTSAFSMTAFVADKDFECHGILSEWTRMADSGNCNRAYFCPDCGNRIYHINPDMPQVIKLKPSTLDDTGFLVPTVHIWVSQKQAWFHIPEGVETVARQPRMVDIMKP